MLDLGQIQYNGESFDAIFAGMGTDLTADDARPRMRDGVPRMSPDGRPTYNSGVVGPSRWGGADSETTVAVIERGTYEFGRFYRLDGLVWIQSFAVQGFGGRARQRQAILAERLIEVPNPLTGEEPVEVVAAESGKGGH